MAELLGVTITGADDSTDPRALLDLSAEFPFVEWGILLSTTREGQSRYPSRSWRERWAGAQQSRAPRWYPWAVHLCGELARRALVGCPNVSELLGTLNGPVRVQLNGFSRWRLPLLLLAEQWPGTEFILQTSNLEAENEADRLRSLHPNVSRLLDASGGLGIASDFYPRPGASWIGYAGGIGPHNVAAVIQRLRDGFRLSRFWIDMETHVRTDERLDLGKVRAVLEAAAPFVAKGGARG